MSKSIIEVLRELEEGGLIDELTIALNAIVEGVRSTGKAGKLTLGIDVRPAGQGAESQMFVKADVKLKIPEPDRAQSFFYVDDDNSLCRENPRQEKLPGFAVVKKDQEENLEEGTG